MLTMEQARERVARGAKLLDEKRPGWAQKIDCGLLQMSEDCFCVLGQLEGSFNNACHLIYQWTNGKDYEAQTTYGFFADAINTASAPELACTWSIDYKGYKFLQDAWIDEIATRVVLPQPAAIPVTVAS